MIVVIIVITQKKRDDKKFVYIRLSKYLLPYLGSEIGGT